MFVQVCNTKVYIACWYRKINFDCLSSFFMTSLNVRDTCGCRKPDPHVSGQFKRITKKMILQKNNKIFGMERGYIKWRQEHIHFTQELCCTIRSVRFFPVFYEKRRRAMCHGQRFSFKHINPTSSSISVIRIYGPNLVMFWVICYFLSVPNCLVLSWCLI